ncbi:MAG: transposase [Oligoflexales bacterium]|nr:transposase [Oligoflexales bacterium]
MEKYDSELKSRIIREVAETGNMTAVARKHDITVSTVHTWVKNDKNKETQGNKVNMKKMKKELEELRTENQILKELLKKTNLVWLKDSK